MDTAVAQPHVATLFPHQLILRSGLAVAQASVDRYLIDFLAGGPVIAITFETAGLKINRGDATREGLGVSFLNKLGYSVLAVKAKRPDWYRSPELHEWFRSALVKAFLADFHDRIFIGSSMGGFAAITFSQITPGALVIAHNPQATLNPQLVPWEPRFPEGRQQDWSGDFAEAADAVPLARKIYVTYDPFHPNDRRHVERLGRGNIVPLKMPFLGHETPEWLKQLGILRQSTEAALAETLTSAEFAKMVRHRRNLPRYHQNAMAVVRKGKYRDVILFDAAKRFESDAALYREAVLRMYERRLDRRGRELYYGRLSLSYQLPSAMQGVLRAQAGLGDQRNDPGPHEPGPRGRRTARMEALAAAVNYQSTDVSELVTSAKFLRALKRWRNVDTLCAAALKLDPKHKDAKQMLAEARKIIAQMDARLTLVQKIRKFFANLW